MGPCISIHGHTWKFEITLRSDTLDEYGFVIDFDVLQERVLDPCHALLDHGFAIGADTWKETQQTLETLGEALFDSRRVTGGELGERQPGLDGELGNAHNQWPGGIKVAVFPFTPTSERLAKWLFEVTAAILDDPRVEVDSARVYETMHPAALIAEYRPSR
jgi:6-pyruvoyl-tetrahydropterin synthase